MTNYGGKLTPAVINNTVLEYSHGRSFLYCLRLLMVYSVEQRSCDQDRRAPQSLKYLLFISLGKFANSAGHGISLAMET